MSFIFSYFFLQSVCRLAPKTNLLFYFFYCSQIKLNFLFILQRFMQYLASSNSTFNLSSFLDKGTVQGITEKFIAIHQKDSQNINELKMLETNQSKY